MKIETLDKALTLSNMISSLQSIRDSLQNDKGFINTLKDQLKEQPEDAMPNEEAATRMEAEVARFNKAWITQLDVKIAELQAEFDAL